jgi:histidinol-phosphate aminotransferase
MTFNPVSLIRTNIATLKPYTPILPFEVLSEQLGRRESDFIKLDANENPYGPVPRVAAALAEAPYLHIYPDPDSRTLRAALADYTGLSADYLMVGHGADELIDLILRLFISPGEAIINCPPTFGMYAFDAEVNDAQVINVRRQPDFSLNLTEIEAIFTDPPVHPLIDEPGPIKLIFVTSPNNPDGSVLSDSELTRLLALPAIVVLDEAYVEFSGGSRIQWVRDYPNLIVLRTFSKWAGLAGLRVGYGAFPLDIIEQLWKIKQPYNVNVAGQIAAQVSLAEREWLLSNVARLVETRDKFYTVLQDIPWLSPYPSQTNFILCRVEGYQAADIKQKLTEQGVLIRYYNSPGLSDHLRFSIGTPEQMVKVAQVLREL